MKFQAIAEKSLSNLLTGYVVAFMVFVIKALFTDDGIPNAHLKP